MSIRDSLIEEFGSFIKENESLKPFTTLKIGGQAEYFLLARDTDTLIRALRFTQKHGVRATVIGGGSNVLIADEGIDGLVIRNISTEIRMVGVSAKRIHGEEQKEVLLEVAAGVPTNSLVRYTADEGLSGLEMHLGLPGTIGGALFMNAKWTIPNLQYISDPLLRVELLTKKGELITVDKSYFNFDYNYSKIQETGDIVLRAVFKLQMKTKDEVWGVANASGEYRKKSQPQGVFSAGCTFRNISLKEALTIPTPEHTTSAGYLLDKAGMKGYSIGGVSVSTQHANFIINSGNATAEEMVQLIAVCKDKVREKFHVSLVEEVKLIGHFIH